VRHAGSLKSCRDREHAQQPRAASGFQSAPTPEQRTVHDPEFGDVDPSLILRGRGRTPERGPLSARWPDRRMPGGQCQGRSTKMGECGLLQVWSMNAIASLEHECENGSGSYSANAGGHFGRRMYPSCRPVRLSPGATSAHPVRSRRRLVAVRSRSRPPQNHRPRRRSQLRLPNEGTRKPPTYGSKGALAPHYCR
jgi:hypothetical protein